mgnify:CR=1 FL=1
MLKKIQQDSHDKFEELGYPSKKLESWKFSPSKHLRKYNLINLDQSNFSIEQYNDKYTCLLYTSPSPRDATLSRMPSSA